MISSLYHKTAQLSMSLALSQAANAHLPIRAAITHVLTSLSMQQQDVCKVQHDVQEVCIVAADSAAVAAWQGNHHLLPS